MVALANIVGASPWFALPHTANDDYQRQFALLVKSRLRPDVNVYVEWGNEVRGPGGSSMALHGLNGPCARPLVGHFEQRRFALLPTPQVWHTGFPGGRFAQSEGLRLNMTEEGAK